MHYRDTYNKRWAITAIYRHRDTYNKRWALTVITETHKYNDRDTNNKRWAKNVSYRHVNVITEGHTTTGGQ